MSRRYVIIESVSPNIKWNKYVIDLKGFNTAEFETKPFFLLGIYAILDSSEWLHLLNMSISMKQANLLKTSNFILITIWDSAVRKIFVRLGKQRNQHSLRNANKTLYFLVEIWII